MFILYVLFYVYVDKIKKYKIRNKMNGNERGWVMELIKIPQGH